MFSTVQMSTFVDRGETCGRQQKIPERGVLETLFIIFGFVLFFQRRSLQCLSVSLD